VQRASRIYTPDVKLQMFLKAVQFGCNQIIKETGAGRSYHYISNYRARRQGAACFLFLSNWEAK
jgi:hypothetical protein